MMFRLAWHDDDQAGAITMLTNPIGFVDATVLKHRVAPHSKMRLEIHVNSSELNTLSRRKGEVHEFMVHTFFIQYENKGFDPKQDLNELLNQPVDPEDCAGK